MTSAREVSRRGTRFTLSPNLQADLRHESIYRSSGLQQTSAITDTFVLHRAGFEGPIGNIDPMGYTTVDRTEQLKAFFHVADGTELNGGTHGNLLPISGTKSMWCGQAPTTTIPYCGYAALPGYGNNWDQSLISSALVGDSVSISYKVFFDTEAGYDGTVAEYTFDGGFTWTRMAVTDTFGLRAGVYEGELPQLDAANSPWPSASSASSFSTQSYITESFSFGSPGASNVRIRFRFVSDTRWSDEDGLLPTDGAIMLDDISIETWVAGVPSVSLLEDFELAVPGSNFAGVWTGVPGSSFGDFATLYPGIAVLQEDPCMFELSYLWGFFDDPAVTSYDCHIPNPRPDVGAMPFAREADRFLSGGYFGGGNLYMDNEIWSPAFPNTGQGDEYRLSFRVYRDLPLDNLQFYTWHVRSWVGGCPSAWRDDNLLFYGPDRDWLPASFSIGSHIPLGADSIQIAIGAVDMCDAWCNVYGSGACHSHAPLVDYVVVERINKLGPQFTVRHPDLFQDNFAQDGTLTGTARADAALDILPSAAPGIVPGDSVAVTISPLVTDPNTGYGPAAYAYVAVWPLGQVGKTPADIEAPETGPGGGKRWPLVGTRTMDGVTWVCLRMDSAWTTPGEPVADRYCIDLNDAVFTPGDTVCYFFSADVDATPNNGNEIYWHRSIAGQGVGRITNSFAEAAASPCEFTILPAGGYNRGGDILYVDDTDDRGGPVELSFDSVFDMLDILHLIDRYDVLGPSSAVGNSLASRVTQNINQIINVYRIIIWNTGDLPSATIGDGTGNPEKSDDFALLYQFLNTSDKGPGLYISGDNVAAEWVTASGAGAINLKSTYMNFNLLRDDHTEHGEGVSPLLTATGPSFIHGGIPEEFVAHGGCPVISAFDVLQPTGTAITEFPYPASGDGAVISQTTTNSANTSATVILSGLSFHSVADAEAGFPIARAEHLRSILIKLGSVAPQPSGVDPDDGLRYANVLEPNYPNPFNPVTTIRYSIRERAHVSLKVYNAAGQLVATLVDEVQSPGEIKPVTWDGMNNSGHSVSSGVYFYKLATKSFSETRKMVLLK
jgi:hypothetical protein